MAKKKTTSRKTSSRTSVTKYSFAQALSFATENNLKAWKQTRSGKPGRNTSEAHEQFAELERFHREVESGGGVRQIVTADPGYAERFCIASQLLALKNNFVVSTVNGLDRTPLKPKQLAKPLRDLELDAPKSYPGRLYHAIVSNLVFPDGNRGPMGLIEDAGRLKVPGKGILRDLEWSMEAPERLRAMIGCDPLAWLLNQYQRNVDVGPVSEKMAIVLSGTNLLKKEVRELFAPKKQENEVKWPAIEKSDQADLVCYLLSGISRLVKALGYKGLVLCLDVNCIFSSGLSEISSTEVTVKNRAKDGKTNSQKNDDEQEEGKKRQKVGRNKSNFKKGMTTCVGGLIWSATSLGDDRVCVRKKNDRFARTKCGHRKVLKHTGTEKSPYAYPFTTEEQCHLGVLYSAASEEGGSDNGFQKYGQHGSILLPN